MEYSLFHTHRHTHTWGLPGGSDSRESASNAGDPGSIPGLGKSPGEGNGNPLQYFAWEILCRGAWWATIHEVAKRVRHDLAAKQQQQSQVLEDLIY